MIVPGSSKYLEVPLRSYIHRFDGGVGVTCQGLDFPARLMCGERGMLAPS